ncbi:MAG: hypothetical protein AVDCRST_MAG85-1171, partial [uncultured Solirubrobacteraceae bacterium]
DPAEGAHALRRGDLHELRLRPRGRRAHRRVRQLRPAGQGRAGDPHGEGPRARREPADLPRRSDARAPLRLPEHLGRGGAADERAVPAGHRRV